MGYITKVKGIMKNLILLYVVACLLLVGCEARKMSVEEIVQTVNSYKRQSTQESLSLAETFLNKGIVDNPGNVVLLKELIAINGVLWRG